VNISLATQVSIPPHRDIIDEYTPSQDVWLGCRRMGSYCLCTFLSGGIHLGYTPRASV